MKNILHYPSWLFIFEHLHFHKPGHKSAFVSNAADLTCCGIDKVTKLHTKSKYPAVSYNDVDKIKIAFDIYGSFIHTESAFTYSLPGGSRPFQVLKQQCSTSLPHAYEDCGQPS